MTTVVLAEDAQLVREGFRALLERAGEFTVVAEASTGTEAVELVEKVKPNVLALEMLLPDLHGLEVLKKIKDCGTTNAVVVSSHSNATYVVESLRCASQGEMFLSRPVRNCTLEARIGRTFGKDNGNDRLTMRERVVLELAAEGLTNGQIADRLSISRRTVESHRASLMQKMGLRSQTDLVRFAIRNKIITA
jgi:DNA-binding NarL/FixJ family response regulator